MISEMNCWNRAKTAHLSLW